MEFGMVFGDGESDLEGLFDQKLVSSPPTVLPPSATN